MNGLILVGGQSTRMGTDKSQLLYHGKPQWQYLYDLLLLFCKDIFLSCRENQKEAFVNEKVLIDPYEIGPIGGILSAFEQDSNEPWLVVACDMPFVNEKSIEFLLQNRKTEQIATSFQNPETQLPEPLLTIWEPSAYPLLIEAHKKGQRSPLRILKHSDVNLIKCPQPDWLKNVNTAEEYHLFSSS
jgi:molybdopterin-guanine dinucleotide biosynthesis protein A